MNRYIIIIFLISLSIKGVAQSRDQAEHAFPGITNWEEVIVKATSESKYIMVDLSTEWCYWCKVMDKQQFRDPEILSLMNSRLNSYMVDAEKDSIGKLLKLKFGIASYPSFIFFTPQGEFIETWHGSMPKKYWMQFIKDSIDQVPLPRLGIPEGLTFNWPSFVQRELKANFKKSTPSSEELNEFFSQCDYKQFTDFNVCRFYPKDIPDALLERIIHDKSWLDANYGHDITKDLIETSISWKGYHQVEIKNWANARSYFSRYQNLFPENAWELFQMNIFYCKNKIEVDSLIQLGLQNDSFVYDHTSDELAEFIFEHGNKESHYKQAGIWNSAELKKAPNFKRAKLQARISAKLNDSKEARHWASLAIEAAKIENIEIPVDDNWIIYLAEHGRIKGDG